MSEFEENVELAVGEDEGDVIEGGIVSDRATIPLDVDEVEGGAISDLEETPVKIDPLKQARALTTRRLAYLLVIMMALSVVGHYIAVIILVMRGNQAAVGLLSDIFTTWLPVISGLAGSAVTYYFTRTDDN